MITFIFVLCLIFSFKVTWLCFKIFGKLLGWMLGIVGYCMLGAFAAFGLSTVVAYVAIPILAVVGVASLVKSSATAA